MNHRPRTSGQQKSRVLSSRNNLASTKKVSSTKTRKKSKSPTSDTANGVKCEVSYYLVPVNVRRAVL